MNRDTIILIGPARSGKSTIGAIIAEKLKNIMKEYAFVFLLLPCEDPEESLAILNSRTDFPLHLATNEFLLKHPSNYILATSTVYTNGKSPEETVDSVIGIFKANSGQDAGGTRP